MYLERIDGPNDVKKLSLEQMDVAGARDAGGSVS